MLTFVQFREIFKNPTWEILSVLFRKGGGGCTLVFVEILWHNKRECGVLVRYKTCHITTYMYIRAPIVVLYKTKRRIIRRNGETKENDSEFNVDLRWWYFLTNDLLNDRFHVLLFQTRVNMPAVSRREFVSSKIENLHSRFDETRRDSDILRDSMGARWIQVSANSKRKNKEKQF